MCDHIRKKTLKKWGPILSCLGRLKKTLEVDDVDSDENDDDVNEGFNDNECIVSESGICEGVIEDMLMALDKDNIYHTHLRYMQDVETREDYDQFGFEYNEWSVVEDDADSENDGVEEVTFSFHNETHFEDIDEHTKSQMYHKSV